MRQVRFLTAGGVRRDESGGRLGAGASAVGQCVESSNEYEKWRRWCEAGPGIQRVSERASKTSAHQLVESIFVSRFRKRIVPQDKLEWWARTY